MDEAESSPWLAGNWSNSFRVDERMHNPWFNHCADVPGVYRLIGSDLAGILHPAALARVCGVDRSGTIYIGAARKLRPRIAGLIRQHFKPFYGSHPHKALTAKLQERFSPSHLFVQWEVTKDGFDPFRRELDLLTRYKAEFGESPPLNGA